ncbi:MAG: L,D-transpeptidase family protein [Rhodothermales bacterium]
MKSKRTAPGRSYRFLRVSILIGLTALAAFAIAWRLTVHPPSRSLRAMDRAFQLLDAEEGSRYAPALTLRAEASRRSTAERWRIEDERPFFFRRYDEIDTLARRSETLAAKGIARTRVVKDSIRARTEINLALIRDRIDRISSQINRLPQMTSLRQPMLDVQGVLVAAEGKRREGDLLESAAMLRRATTLLDSAGIRLDQMVTEYFDALPEWRQWAAETVQWSRSKRAVVLVVDKLAHACHVYSNGRRVASFSVELGPKWVGPKRYEGDLSTPEGKYLIRRKRGPGETSYYLALEINYPNDDDRRWFADAKRAGILANGARLGGNIEIHGNGGRAFNWTVGCIALNNEDMRAVFDLVVVGTPVTIVGAMENFYSRIDDRVSQSSDRSSSASLSDPSIG